MPSEFVFEPRSPRYGPFLVSGCWCTLRRFFWTFWRLFGPFLEHIVELEGTKGPLVARKSIGTWSVTAVCLRLAGLNPYQGCFGRKMAVFGPKLRRFGRAPPDLAPLWPPVSFWAKTWIWQGHHVSSKMVTWANDPKRWDGAMAKTARRRVVACCLLLLLVVS